MHKFVFTLGRLLDYKGQILETEKNLLRQLRQKQMEINERIEALEREFLDTDRREKEKQKKGILVQQVRMYEYQKENIRYQLKQTRLELRKADIEVERQMKVVVTASQEVTGLDKLKEKQLEEYQVEVARDDENTIAEFVSQKLVREAAQ